MRDVIPVGEFFKKTQQAPQVQPVPDVIPVNEFFKKEEVEKPTSLGRKAGLAGRDVIEGVAGLATFVPDLAGAGLQALTGKQVLEPLSPMVSETLTGLGFPEAETKSERLASNIVQGATGGAAKKFGTGLAQRGIASISGATGGGAAGVAREEGASVPVQAVAGLAGGLTGAAGARNLASRLGDAPDEIIRDVAQRGIDEVAAFTNVRKDIVKNSLDTLKRKNRLYKLAETKGADAFVAPDKLTILTSKVDDLKDNIFDANGRASLDLVAGQLNKLSQGGRQSVNELQLVRRGLTKLKTSSDGGVRNAAREATNLLDDFLIQKGNVSGKRDSVKLWNKAIKTNREYMQKFDEPTEIAKAVSDEANEVVEQAFIGSGGASLNKKLSTVYDNTMRAVKPSQKKETAFRLKQSILNRMIKNAAQSVDEPEGVSASRLANQIRNFKRDNQSMWSKFNEKEKSAMVNLEKNLRKEIKGGVVNQIVRGVEKFTKGGLGQNVELPRTLKAKQVVTIDDLLQLTTKGAGAKTGEAITLGVGQSILNEGE